MKKKGILAVGCMLLLFLMCGFGTLAEDMQQAEERVWVRDQAGLLTEAEAASLNTACRQASEAHNVGVSIVTTENFGGSDINVWQRQLFSEYELGMGDADSGVMLAVSMAERDWGIQAFGDAQDIFGTYQREQMAEQFLDDLADGNYYDAFLTYIDSCDWYMTRAEQSASEAEGNAYAGQQENPGSAPQNPAGQYSGSDLQNAVPIPVIIGTAFVISLLVSLFIVMKWKKSMNTKVQQKGATQYYREESFALTENADLFLYRTVNRKAKPKENRQKPPGGPRPSKHPGPGPRPSGSSGMHSSRTGTRGKF